MAAIIYTKPAVRSSWGQTATVNDLQDPGDTYASLGWQLGVKPPRQYFNWVLNYAVAGIRYLCQQGVAIWDANELYPINALTVGPDGRLVRSLVANNSNNNPTTTFGTAWGSAAVPSPAASSNDSSIPNTSWTKSNFLPVGASFGSITGSVSPSQVPVGAVTQWQGSLSLSGAQIGSAVARANTLNISGNYATFNWSGQSGQPSWLFGSNDGINVYVYNPSNFSVNNSNLLQGLSPVTAAQGSTVMVRDASGYSYSVYHNASSPNNEGSVISQFLTTTGSDGFYRKNGVAAVINTLQANGVTVTAQFLATLSANGVQHLPSGLIIQWGYASSPSSPGTPIDIGITFPLAFPTFCAAVVCATNRNTGTSGPAVDGSNFTSNYSPTGCTITVDNIPGGSGGHWIAIGW